MADYSQTFFMTDRHVFVYLPQRKALLIEGSINPEDIRESVRDHVAFLMSNQDDLSKVIFKKHNRLLQRMEVKRIIFNAFAFAEQVPTLPNRDEWHKNRVLVGKDKEVVDALNEVLPCGSPFYYASGLGLFWQLELNEAFVLIKDPKEKEFTIKELPDLELFLRNHPDIETTSLSEGFHDGREHHGWDSTLLNDRQRRAYRFIVKQRRFRDEKKFMYFSSSDYFPATEYMAAREVESHKAMLLMRQIYDKFDVEMHVSDRLQFLVVVK